VLPRFVTVSVPPNVIELAASRSAFGALVRFTSITVEPERTSAPAVKTPMLLLPPGVVEPDTVVTPV
jgi:hypothetical protein